MSSDMHRVTCGCGWSYETTHRDFGSLYCSRQYAEHVEVCPLRVEESA